MEKKRIFIFGAGFAGLNVALGLKKIFANSGSVDITLADKNSYHLFAPNLYEAASSEEEFVSIAQLKKSLAIPVEETLEGSSVKFLQSEITHISLAEKTLKAGMKSIAFDFLVVASGSQSFYFGIPGAQEFSLPLKTAGDAFRIRNALEFSVQKNALAMQKPYIRFVVAGGGYTGVEFAGELANLRKILAWKYEYPLEKIQIIVLEAGNELIPGFSSRLSKDSYFRLKSLGVEVRLLAKIAKVEKSLVHLSTGEAIGFDAMVWAAGVMARKVPFSEDVGADARGRLMVDEYLRLKDFPFVFVAGDAVCARDLSGCIAPPCAQDATHQGRYVAKALAEVILNRKPKPYTNLSHGFIVMIGGKWAILSYGRWYLKGFFAYVVDKVAHFRYFYNILGFWKALKYSYKEVQVFGRND